MFRTMTTGLLFALLAGAMGAADAQALNWPPPQIACTDDNAWSLEDTYYDVRTRHLTITWQCDPSVGWTLFMVCNRAVDGFCTAF